MRVTTVNCEALRPPGGHYAHAALAGDFIFLSGQLPVDRDGHVPDGFEAQAELALDHLLAALDSAGGQAEDLAKVTAYIVGVEHWGTFNAIYARRLGAATPARSVVPVPELHFGALVEIEAIALRR
jgi:2-iminobutanoate/2-iminopropanoate deaminase